MSLVQIPSRTKTISLKISNDTSTQTIWSFIRVTLLFVQTNRNFMNSTGGCYLFGITLISRHTIGRNMAPACREEITHVDVWTALLYISRSRGRKKINGDDRALLNFKKWLKQSECSTSWNRWHRKCANNKEQVVSNIVCT